MTVWGQLCRTTTRAGAAALSKQTLPNLNGQLATPISYQQMRGMASGGHHGHEVTYKGLTLHAPATWHTVVGKGMCSVMWFWVFFRAYHDGETFLFGHAQHFEHELEHGGHSEHH